MNNNSNSNSIFTRVTDIISKKYNVINVYEELNDIKATVINDDNNIFCIKVADIKHYGPYGTITFTSEFDNYIYNYQS